MSEPRHEFEGGYRCVHCGINGNQAIEYPCRRVVAPVSTPERTRPCERCEGAGRVPNEAVIGAEIRAERERRDITLREAARRLGISAATMSNIERGRMALTGPAGSRAMQMFADGRAAPSTPESETEHERAVKAVVDRLKSDGLCGEVFVDGLGQEVICILEAPCERHVTPTEPPADRDAVAELVDVIERLREPRHKYASAEVIAQRLEEVLALLRPEGQEPVANRVCGVLGTNEAGHTTHCIRAYPCEVHGYAPSPPAPEAASEPNEDRDALLHIADDIVRMVPASHPMASAAHASVVALREIAARLAAPEARPEKVWAAVRCLMPPGIADCCDDPRRNVVVNETGPFRVGRYLAVAACDNCGAGGSRFDFTDLHEEQAEARPEGERPVTDLDSYRGDSLVVKDGIVLQIGNSPGVLDAHVRPNCMILRCEKMMESPVDFCFNDEDAAVLVRAAQIAARGVQPYYVHPDTQEDE